MIICNGEFVPEQPFTVMQHSSSSTEIIPSIRSSPIKFLGRVIKESLSDKDQVGELISKVESSLIVIDKSLHLGVNKVWILQNLLLPQLRWLLMIYEISISVTASLERKISKYIRKWFGLSQSLSPIALYSKLSPCPLPISSLVGIEKTAKAGALLQLRDSADTLVSGVSPSLRAGRTWSVVDAVSDAESILYFRKLLGSPAKGRCGLGYIPRVPLAPKGTKEHRKAVCDTLFEEHDKQLLQDTIQKYANAASKGSPQSNEIVTLQLHWSYWCDYIRNDLSWKAIWAMGPDLMRFAVQSTFNTMSCPKNEVRWKESADPSCDLCSHSPCTIPHILSGCQFSLNSGRYTFRHDSVVKVMVDAIINVINKKKSSPPTPSKVIKFVKAGAKEVARKKRPPTGILDEAKDWVLHCDLGGDNPTVPSFIAVTESRPDIFIFSSSSRYAISIENTSGCEENFSARNADKIARYDALEDAITSNGWKHVLFCVEVGARGYCANNVLSCFKSLGFSNKLARDTVKDLGLTAMKASFAIWLARADKSKSFQAVPHPPNVAKIGPLLNPPVTSTVVSSPVPSAPSPSPSSYSPYVSHSSGPIRPISPHPSSSGSPVFSSSPIGLRNLGQTCYVNTILQSLAVSFDAWSCIIPRDLSSAHFLKYLVTMMKLMKFRSSKVDPAHFVDRLGALISRARGVIFIANRANDVPEVLGYILAEMLTHCPDSSRFIFSTSFKVDRSCDVCFSSSFAEEQVSMLRVPVRSTIQASIDDFFISSRLEGPNQRYCGVCGINQDASTEVSLVKPPDLLIVHLVRFTQVGASNFIKNSMAVHCDQSISMVEKSSEPHTSHSYDLISVIEHSGPFDNGHYTCVVREPRSGQFFFCNDSVVKPVDVSQFKAPYVLFYRRRQLSV